MTDPDTLTLKSTKKSIKRALIKLCIALFIVILVGEGVLAYYLYKNPIVVTEERVNTTNIYIAKLSEAQLELQKLSQVSTAPKDVNSLFTTGWIADWDMVGGYNALMNRIDNFDGISPFWFSVNPDGSLNELYSSVNDDLMLLSKTRNFELIPTIPIFDENLISSILNSPENTERHISQIVEKIRIYDYDGIDLDYESFFLKDKKQFLYFIEELSKRIHAIGKKLVFTAIPKWGDTIDYKYFPQTRRVQEYKFIADLVDEFRIMTYDFTGRGSGTAGPLGPLEWIEKVIQYSISIGIPREKIVIGLHTYAYVWTTRPVLENVELISWDWRYNPQQLEPALAYNFDDVEVVLNRHPNTTQYNETWGESISRININGTDRVMIYMDQRGIDARKNLAAKYGIKGIAFWRLGNNGSLSL